MSKPFREVSTGPVRFSHTAREVMAGLDETPVAAIWLRTSGSDGELLVVATTSAASELLGSDPTGQPLAIHPEDVEAFQRDYRSARGRARAVCTGMYRMWQAGARRWLRVAYFLSEVEYADGEALVFIALIPWAPGGEVLFRDLGGERLYSLRESGSDLSGLSVREVPPQEILAMEREGRIRVVHESPVGVWAKICAGARATLSLIR